MRKLIVLTGMLALMFTINAQDIRESDVPAAVKSKFSSMYPNITKAKWEMENGNYEAEFKEHGTETSVIIDANGTYLMKETELNVSSLPPAVSEYASKNLPGKTINEASKITLADGTVNYEAEIGKDDYYFDANGSFLKKETDSSDDEDDDNKLKSK